MASIAPITPAAEPAAAAATGPSAEKKAQDQKTQFLQLLVAQLKGQNPLNPLDGTQFVTQLAQFSSLEQLVAINTTLETMKGRQDLNQESSVRKAEQAATTDGADSAEAKEQVQK
jgi:flagellar basal-body rod modification protein FlgD